MSKMQAEVLEEDPWSSLTADGRPITNRDAYQAVPSSASPPSSADPMDSNRQGEESIETPSRCVNVCVQFIRLLTGVVF